MTAVAELVAVVARTETLEEASVAGMGMVAAVAMVTVVLGVVATGRRTNQW